MSLLLNWRVWLLTGLLALVPILYLKGRSDGKNNVRKEWMASVAEANTEARRMEQLRQARASDAAAAASARNTAIRGDAASARSSADRLRGTLDATERRAKESADAAARLVSTYRAVLESCAAEYRALGEEAAGHASDSLMYQQGWSK